MNKKVIMANIAAIMASNIALAGQDQAVVSSAAKPLKAKNNQMAYGCFGNGQGEISCEGTINKGCIGSGTGKPTPLPSCVGKCQGVQSNPNCQGNQNCQGSPNCQGAGNCGGSKQSVSPIDESTDSGLD